MVHGNAPQTGLRFWPVAFALLLCVSCRSSEEQWSFSISRSGYEGLSETSMEVEPGSGMSGGPELFAVLVGIALLPIAIDVALLPVTLPHDVLSIW